MEGFAIMTKRKRATDKDTEVLDRMDCISRAIANLKMDIPELVRKAVSDIIKERRRYVDRLELFAIT